MLAPISNLCRSDVVWVCRLCSFSNPQLLTTVFKVRSYFISYGPLARTHRIRDADARPDHTRHGHEATGECREKSDRDRDPIDRPLRSSDAQLHSSPSTPTFGLPGFCTLKLKLHTTDLKTRAQHTCKSCKRRRATLKPSVEPS